MDVQGQSRASCKEAAPRGPSGPVTCQTRIGSGGRSNRAACSKRIPPGMIMNSGRVVVFQFAYQDQAICPQVVL